MSNVPLPEPHHQSAANFNAPDEPFYTADQMRAHAAAVSAAKDARIKVLEEQLAVAAMQLINAIGYIEEARAALGDKTHNAEVTGA